MADLTTLADVKQWLSLSTTTDDALLARLITAASEAILTWLDTDLVETDYTEVRNGHGGNRMMLKHRPVSKVKSVVIDGMTIPQSTGPFGPGWVNDALSVYLREPYGFRRDVQNVQVTYTAGYEEVPAEVAQACIELIALRYKERDRIGLISKGLAGETITFSQKDFTNSVRTTLNQYRNVVPL